MADSENVPAHDEKPVLNKTWLFVALIALIAAFLFQWRNELDQAAIAQTDSGSIVRAKIERADTTRFRIFYNGDEKISNVLIYSNSGEEIATVSAEDLGDKSFRVFCDAATSEKIARERFVRLVIPTLRHDDKPVILLVRSTETGEATFLSLPQ